MATRHCDTHSAFSPVSVEDSKLSADISTEPTQEADNRPGWWRGLMMEEERWLWRKWSNPAVCQRRRRRAADRLKSEWKGWVSHNRCLSQPPSSAGAACHLRWMLSQSVSLCVQYMCEHCHRMEQSNMWLLYLFSCSCCLLQSNINWWSQWELLFKRWVVSVLCHCFSHWTLIRYSLCDGHRWATR